MENRVSVFGRRELSVAIFAFGAVLFVCMALLAASAEAQETDEAATTQYDQYDANINVNINAEVIPGTVPKKPLPNTGGMPLIGLAVLGIAFVGVGFSILRHSVRRRS